MQHLTLFELVGWIGAICLAVCCLPQAWLSFKQKHSNGVSNWLIILWGLGEVLTLIYVWPTGQMPLIYNYAANIVLLAVIAYYKIFPGESK